MNLEQFYITLPSNSSNLTFPSNTKANFTTNLYEQLNFDYPYEVALTEIIFPSVIQEEHEIGNISIIRFATGTNQTVKDHHSFPIYTSDITNSHIDKITDKINKRLLDTCKNLQLYTIPQLSINYNYSIKKFYLKFNEFDKTCAILMYGEIADILNFNKSDAHTENRISTGQRALNEFEHGTYSHISYAINSFYVYTDIIRYQIIGDSSKQLLRTVHVDNEKSTQNNIYTNPNYLPISKNSINQIQISIKDSQNEFIKFNSGSQQVILTLHFRPQKYGF